MTRLAFLSCALLAACGGNTQPTDKIYDFAGIDLAGHHVNDAGQVLDGSDTVFDMTGLDLSGNPTGPTFTVVSPTATSAHTSVMLDVKVIDMTATLSAADIKCTIRSMNDTPLTATAIPNGFEVTANIVFANYNPVLDGPSVIGLSVTDSKGVTGQKSIDLDIDDSGPAITSITPVTDTVIGGPTHVSAVIDDSGSGVDPTMVFATFTANATFQIPLLNTLGNVYAGDFDASLLGKNFIFPTLTIRAVDKLGNSSDVSYELIADNTQPLLSLDPPNIRIEKTDTTNGKRECSASFDPVGSDAINDPYNIGQEAQLITVRARVEDQPNSATGQTVHYISGVDASTVKLVAIPAPPGNDPNTGLPPILAVDSDGDGVCDTLNPRLSAVTSGSATTSSQYLAIVMNPLQIGGTPDFRPDTTTPLPDGCDEIGDTGVTTAPMRLCDAVPSNYTYSLLYSSPGTPSIWTIGTVGGDGVGLNQCVGKQFDTLNLLPEGWACFAVIASDRSGNHAISAPLRACIRRTTSTACSTPAPDCTGTYTAAGGTTATACTPQVFTDPIRPQ